MATIRAMIVDDEPLARRGIRAQLNEEKDIEIVSECRNGREAVAAITEQSPDLVFLDVQMPELDGFGVLDAVGVDRMPAVIFVTAYDRYALRAFEVHALEYLLKPFMKFGQLMLNGGTWQGRRILSRSSSLARPRRSTISAAGNMAISGGASTTRTRSARLTLFRPWKPAAKTSR
jgi:DNA-binding LytR/AlgR family response regulator